MGRFADDSAVTQVDDDHFGATLVDGYAVIGGALHGGYLMTVASRAMALAVDRPDPVTVTAHFLRPPTVGDAEVRTEVVRPGGRHATVAARLLQDGVECVRLIGTYADLSTASGVTDQRREPPQRRAADELADPVALADAAPEGSFPIPDLFRSLQLRSDPRTWGWALGQPDGTGTMQSWCRLHDDEPLDSHGLLFLADVLPPAMFNLGGPLGWVPTVELTVHVRRRPPAGWVDAEFRTASVTDGYGEEDGELWSEDGHLLALSRQSALAPRQS